MPQLNSGNLFKNIPSDRSAEIFEELVGGGAVRIERIISRGHSTAEGEWYDQDSAEWVVV